MYLFLAREALLYWTIRNLCMYSNIQSLQCHVIAIRRCRLWNSTNEVSLPTLMLILNLCKSLQANITISEGQKIARAKPKPNHTAQESLPTAL